jgi:exosortase C (VPDSG-CTERM-specific)
LSDLATRPGEPAARFRRFALAVALVSLVFCIPLWRLVAFALADDLFSYIPLMPLVSLYLGWVLKGELPAASVPARVPAALFFGAGAAVLAGRLVFAHTAALAAPENALALSTFGWLMCVAGAGFLCLGGATMRALVFPFGLLLFMIPLPSAVRAGVESGLQQGSAAMADWMFALTGMVYWRSHTIFQLPGITLEVAPECSGIHSTWVLFITSLVAARLILRQTWRRTLLGLVVIPLALLRNGFRVLVIGQLCVHIGPQMIDSPIHHHGGPIFFVLSLVPLFLLLFWLKKGEKNAA